MARLTGFYRAALALALASLMAGCAVGPNYSRPQLPSPPQYRFAADPAWSPDSSRIAFVAAIVGRPGRLTVMNIDGTNQTDVLGHDLHVAVYPAWTADGKQLTYGAPDDNRKVQVMQTNLDGTGTTELTHGPREHSYAAWSPDGQYLAYVSDPGAATGDLCIYDVLAGEHDHVALSGLDRWGAGTHLQGRSVWRYDRAARKLVCSSLSKPGDPF
jgi:dipeptidyl aminopeptidase/acylaminoacyl peptidase